MSYIRLTAGACRNSFQDPISGCELRILGPASQDHDLVLAVMYLTSEGDTSQEHGSEEALMLLVVSRRVALLKVFS